MKHEKSCGAVIFRYTNGSPFYLVIKYAKEKNYWGLAKGHVEDGETEKETTIREIGEETGIDEMQFLDHFREIIYYMPKANIAKEVVFFLVQTHQSKVQSLCGEHDDFSWLSYEKAREKLSYEKDKEILQKAHHFIKNLHY